ncbi:MAG TPA: methyltransferase [Xanthobacteraceae bacterium]
MAIDFRLKSHQRELELESREFAADVLATIELMTGRWRSQILHAGVQIGVFEELVVDYYEPIDSIARATNADRSLLYRLCRALASLGLLIEDEERRFAITDRGKLLRANHPQSLRAMALLEEGAVHYAVWRHLPELIRTGAQDGFSREFEVTLFEYLRKNPSYAKTFQEAMSSYSASETYAIRMALKDPGFGSSAILCDIGGGYGHLLDGILQDHPEASGIVFDLTEVTADTSQRQTTRSSAAGRCRHVAGNMFDEVPAADAYFMKHILHDWNDAECRQILAAARKSAKPAGRLYICELIVPGPGDPHFAKLFDIHMLCVSSGRQRTRQELEALLSMSGWKSKTVHLLGGSPMAVLEARAD